MRPTPTTLALAAMLAAGTLLPAAAADCNGGPPCTTTLGNAQISVAPESTPGVADDGFGFHAKAVQVAGFTVPLNGGLTQWAVNGLNRVFAQTSFWRIGGDTREHSLASLGVASATVDDANQQVRVSYGQAGAGGTPISVNMIYTLQGPIPGRSSQVLRDVQIVNNTGAALDLSWFDYGDLDISATGFQDAFTTELHGGPGGTRVITQSDATGARGAVVSQWGSVQQDGVFLPSEPAGYAIDVFDGRLPQFGGRANLLDQLLDNGITQLTDVVTNAGSADLITAVQFDFGALRDQATLRQVMTAVPEPGSLPLVAAALLLGLRTLRRRR